MKRQKGLEFSNEKKKYITQILNGYDPKKIKAFITYVQADIWMNNRLQKYPGRKENKKDLKRILKNIETTINDLDYLGGKGPIPLRTVNDIVPHQFDLISRVYRFTMKNVLKARPPLKKLIKLLEYALKVEKRQSGQPRADERSLVTMIAHSYARFIDPPDSYIHRRGNTGSFPQVVDAILDDNKDHNRAIKQALKKYVDIFNPLEFK